MCLLVYRGICLHLPAQITPHKHTPKTNTHTTIHLDPKGEEVWIMLALRDGQANQIHLETIGEGVQKGKLQEGVKGGEGKRGVKNHRPKGSSPAAVRWPVVVMPIHTHTHTHKTHAETQTNPCHG